MNLISSLLIIKGDFNAWCAFGQRQLSSIGAVHKRRWNFLAIFDTPLPHVEISTLIYLTPTFYIISCNIEIWDPPPRLKYFDVFYGWPHSIIHLLYAWAHWGSSTNLCLIKIQIKIYIEIKFSNLDTQKKLELLKHCNKVDCWIMLASFKSTNMFYYHRVWLI